MKPNFMIFFSSFMESAFGVPVRSFCLNQDHGDVLPIFSSRRFRMSGVTCRPLIYFYLIFVQSLRQESGFLPCVYPIIATPCAGPFLIEWLCPFYHKSIGLVWMRLFVDSVLLYVFIFLCFRHTLSSLLLQLCNLEIRRVVPPILFLQIVSAVSVPSLFHINFRNELSVTAKKKKILLGFSLELY